MIIKPVAPADIPTNCIGLYASGTNIVRKTSSGTTENIPTAGDISALAGDISTLQGEVAGFSAIPAGVMLPYGGASAPSGWLLCYGQAVSRTTYSALFTAIGTAYGSGDGSTTFNIPDARGRVLVGKDNMGGSAASRVTSAASGVDGATLGASGGAETHTLTSAQMPVHSHTVTQTGHNHAALQYVGSTGSYNIAAGSNVSGMSSSATADISINNAGSGNAHNNMQPSLISNVIIKV